MVICAGAYSMRKPLESKFGQWEKIIRISSELRDIVDFIDFT